ncbi:PilZ domain-containing protein [Cohnella silvisoli]|uniref:PilZ domain-containing protein n=1 Tax=Cohnella silvisoli TaxID=2873699 RepID=A0ABV1L4J0_9BACL|nr:PilZ domain-containing protein [Cohnella silvisoli]MCD9026001.1 PilZ domain-containing protein [Cohnella silvisoli]
MTQNGDTRNIKSDRENELLPLNALLHCRTVVEGKNFVTTGVMTNLEGELFEVEIHEYDQFELGETVKLTIYSPIGIQSMPSVVFAKYEGAIALLQPPDVVKRFKERREHPRVEITGKAQIVHVFNENGEEFVPENAKPFIVHDISISGISFSGQDAPHLLPNSRLKAMVEIGFGFSCELEIVRRERHEDVLHCGAKMRVLEPEMLRPLRALILRQQVEKHAQTRRDLVSKRTFNG